MQESFSYTDFNLFRVLGFLTFVNTIVRQIISRIQPFKLFRHIINNSIILGVCIIQAVHSVYNWRQIIQNMVVDDEEEIEVKGIQILGDKKDYKVLPWLTIS